MSEVMTLEQTAKYLHLHPVTLRNKARKGLIPACKMGREWRFIREQLDSWLGSSEDMPQELEDWALIAVAEDRLSDPKQTYRPFEEFLAERTR